MTSHQVNIVLAEGAVPSEQLVEGVALSTIVVLLEQTTSSSLVTVVHVHVAHAVAAVVVETEVNSELQALQPTGLSIISTQNDTCTYTGSVALVLGLIVEQSTQWVVVVV